MDIEGKKFRFSDPTDPLLFPIMRRKSGLFPSLGYSFLFWSRKSLCFTFVNFTTEVENFPQYPNVLFPLSHCFSDRGHTITAFLLIRNWRPVNTDSNLVCSVRKCLFSLMLHPVESLKKAEGHAREKKNPTRVLWKIFYKNQSSVIAISRRVSASLMWMKVKIDFF